MITTKASVVWFILVGNKIYECPKKCSIDAEMIGDRPACSGCGYWLVLLPWVPVPDELVDTFKAGMEARQ